MLSTNSTSSIQTRRNHHRRQQSLEVPILATPLPANPRRNQQGSRGHRRGLSLDQSLTAINKSAGFRPLQPQDQPTFAGPLTGSPQVRIQQDPTNTGQLPHDTQHYPTKQETQQQSIAQPGYQAQDFQSHLQQQLNGTINPPPHSIAQPTPTIPHQQHALQELQHHLDWYRNMCGSSPIAANMTAQPCFNPHQPAAAPSIPTAMRFTTVQPQQPIHTLQARTVPNTPQTYTQGWPSPPPTTAKHARSQSFQLDVAPMPGSFQSNLSQELTSFPGTNDYASSNYSSSQLDAASPGCQARHMPTLFEESTIALESQSSGLTQPADHLLHATGGAQDFNDPDFVFGTPQITAASPHQALVNQLGPDMPASIVETGVHFYEVQQYIGDFDESDKKYPCMYNGCNKRFGRKENVRAHVQTHLGDRQFKCDLCDKTFVRQHDLKRHITIHSDDRPHGCICGQSFARHDALTRHRQRGMCAGTLPGFEKDPADMPKRGRPKKQRPEMDERVDKAAKTRKNVKRKAAEAATREGAFQSHHNYASSNYTASDRSFPVTPPDTSDAFDTDAFLNMAEVGQHSSATAWKDTPPTSPATGISPSMLSNKSAGSGCDGWSSPAEFQMGGDELGTVGAQPDAYEEMFSPPGESMTNSSVYGWSDNGLPFDPSDLTVRASDAMAPFALFGDSGFADEQLKAGKSLADVLDQWLAAN